MLGISDNPVSISIDLLAHCQFGVGIIMPILHGKHRQLFALLRENSDPPDPRRCGVQQCQLLGMLLGSMMNSNRGSSEPLAVLVTFGTKPPRAASDTAIRYQLATGVHFVSTFRVDPTGSAIDHVTSLQHR